MKRPIAFVLALIFILSILPLSVFATAMVASGSCGENGDNVTWTLDSEGTLTISGSGNMKDFAYYDIAPWYDQRRSVKNVIINPGVTSIGDLAFYDCSSLTSITIPSSVTSIGTGAFFGCSSLESISVAKGNTKYHSEGNCLIETKSKTMILGCKNSVIPSDGSVTSIGEDAFSGCSNLTSITIPEGVTSIGEDAFSGCSSLTSITIPEGVTSIGRFAFADCRSLTSITIPEGVTSIGSYAFDDCSSLESVSVAKGNTKYHSEGNCLIETKSKTMILGCKNSVIPSDGSVTSIGWNAFDGCRGLTSVTIPEGVTSIGRYAFRDCSSLTSITIPEGVTSIGEDAFYYCSSLTSITIPEGVTSIGRYAFRDCSSLTSITIPSSVTSIEGHAFSGCSSLKTVYYSGSQTAWKAISIEDDNTSLTDADVKYNHTHQFIDNVVKPTCTEEGYTEHICIYGEKFIDSYVPARHTPVGEGVITPATCTGGYTTFICADCGAEFTGDYTSPVHDYEKFIVPPTCTAKGYTLHKCVRCSDGYTDSYVDMISHNYKNTIVSPTCTERGYTLHKCESCGDEYKDTYTEAPGHQPVFDPEVPATDKEPGKTVGSHCERCGEVFIKQEDTPIKTLSRAVLEQIPTKLTYRQNKEELNLEGGKLKLVFTDATSTLIDITEDMVTGFDNTKQGKETLTVTYGEYTATFDIEIIKETETLGDVSGDSRINIADAMVLFGHVAGNIKTLNNEAAADVTKDGKINIADAMKLFAYVAGTISAL